ncbi:MAG: hypothetical protein QM520_03780 [Gammaproteobacteria bacterium]|nr:hypothetical protein [Gammaproteobacteria bacterium]
MDLARSWEHWRGKISADVSSWWKELNQQLPIEDKIRKIFGLVKSTQLPYNQVILCQSDSGKLVALGLSWRNIVMAGKKASESLARSAQASYFVVYLGQCVGFLRTESELPTQKEIYAGSILVARSSSTDDTAFAFSTPEPEKVWVGGIRNRRPVGQELILNRGAELNAWMEQQKSRYPYIHTDLDLAEVLPFLPQHVIALQLQKVIAMQAYTADSLVSLPKSTLLHNFRTNKKWQLAGGLLLTYMVYELYQFYAQQYDVEKINKQKAQLYASESPELLWLRSLENFTKTKIQPSSETLPKLLDSMANLQLNEEGWHLKSISCKGSVPVQASSYKLPPVSLYPEGKNQAYLGYHLTQDLATSTRLAMTAEATGGDTTPRSYFWSVAQAQTAPAPNAQVANTQVAIPSPSKQVTTPLNGGSVSQLPENRVTDKNTSAQGVGQSQDLERWTQVWNCEGVYNREVSKASITSSEFIKRIPEGFNLTWEPLNTARLNWQVAIPVKTLDWRQGLLTRAEHILHTSSRLQEMSNYVSTLPALSFNKLSFPDPTRKDGSKLEKPKFVPDIIEIPFKFSYPLVSLVDINQHIPGDWRSFSIGLNFNFAGQSDALDNSSKTSSNLRTALTFTLEGSIYGKEK